MKFIKIKYNIKYCNIKMNFVTVKVGITMGKIMVGKDYIKHSDEVKVYRE